jgi:apolipoprotein N-acyltransferase
LLHAVFRAVENRRPLLRSGNNSDTCLILPDGRITGILVDPVTGSRFVRGTNVYDLPVWDDLPTTFYTSYGDVFAVICFVVFIVQMLLLAGWWLCRKQLLWRCVSPACGHAADV